MPAAVFITRDREARVMDANRFCAEMLRVPLGSNVSKSAPDLERPRNFRAMRGGVEIAPENLPVQMAAARGEEVRDCEFDLVFDDGEVRHFMGNATPLRSADGAPAGAVGAFLDITQRKNAEAALQESSERLSAILDQLPVAVGVLDAEGRYVLGNTALRSFDLERMPSRDPLMRTRWRAEDGHGSPLPLHEWPGARALRGEVVNPGIEFRYVGDDGRERWCIVTAVPLRGGADSGCTGAISVIADITERKLMEHAEPGSEQARPAAASSRGLPPLMHGRGLVFRVEVPETATWTDADAVRVTQILGNLLHNAAKFTRRGDQVALALRVVGDEAEISVRDTGAGIDPGVLPQIFDAFVQGQQTLARSDEVAQAIRADGKNGSRLIALTGYAQPEDVKRAADAGFDGHVAKPCDPDEIERLLS